MLWIVVLAIGVLAASVLLFATQPGPAARTPQLETAARPIPAAPVVSSSTQPIITWSPTSTDVTLSPGEATSRDFSLTSSVALQNVLLEAAPAIAGFLSIQPNRFAVIPAGQPQSAQVSFAIPQGAALGTYYGTIHVRAGNRTLPQTLKLSLRIWSAIQINGVLMKFPPTVTPQSSGEELRFVDLNQPTLPPLFFVTVTSSQATLTGASQEILRRIAQQTLGEDILSFGPTLGNGLLVDATTLFERYFFWYDPNTLKIAEIIEGQTGFFSSSDFAAMAGTLQAVP